MIKKITNFEIAINPKNVLQLVDCNEDNEIYSEVIEEFEEILEEAYKKIEPVALLAIGKLGEFEEKIRDLKRENNNGSLQGIYSITSIGPEMSEWSTQLFNEGDYLKGMLVDAMADDYLFQMSAHLKPFIMEMCLEGNWGVDRRLEAPLDVPMDIQRRAWELTKAMELARIDIKKSFMYNPVKSTCQVFLLKENSQIFNVAHNCSTCPNLNCKLRKAGSFEVTVGEEDGPKVLSGETGESLLAVLRRNNIPIVAPCGGSGTCGKCKIQVTEGEMSPSREDMNLFTKQELEAGYRLACHAYPESSCAIKVISGREEKFEVLTTMEMLEGVKRRKSTKGSRDAEKIEGIEDVSYGIAVDIGTTTIAMQLVELTSGKVVEVYTTINSGRSFGADVISRIEASNNGEGEALRKKLLLDLQKGIEHFQLYKKELEEITIEKMHIAANTTLIHLLMGVSCKTLGVSPFTPVIIDIMNTTYVKLFKGMELCMTEDFPIMIFPGITTYVGGDIVAGLYGLDIEEQDKVSVLIDLGTNGEIAIGNKNKIMVSSTAAGPAFEGGNITCGVGSIPGGIYGVTLEGKKPLIQTIGNKAPIGICGTGVVDVVYELLKEELIDETGRLELEDEDFSEGFRLAYTEQGKEIVVTQKDIREIQLAKSAIRAGLETLIHHYGVTYDEIENIYIAGGFGYKLDINKAVGIGLLPKEAKEKIKAVGNSALHGVNLSLFDSQVETSLQEIRDVSAEIHLGSDKKFNQFYMEYMYLA